MRAVPARIGALWFGVQATWGAVLGVSLQARSLELAGTNGVAAYATIAAIGAAIAALVQVLAGPLSDRRRERIGHRREFYGVGLAITLPSLVLLYAAPNYGLLLLAFAGLQLGINIISAPFGAAVPDHIEFERQGRASAWMSAYQFLGNCAGLIIAAYVAGFATGLLLSAIFAIGFAVTFAHLRRLPTDYTHAPMQITRDVRTLLFSRGFVNIGFYTLLGFLFFYVHESLGVADARTLTGLLFIAFTASGVLGAVFAGRPSDRYDKRVVVSVAAVAVALTVGALAAANSVPAAFGAAAFAGVAWGAFFTADWAIAYAVLPRESMATAMGVWNLSAALPQLIAPIIAAPLVAAFDARALGLGPRAALVSVILEFAIGTALLWRLPPMRLS